MRSSEWARADENPARTNPRKKEWNHSELRRLLHLSGTTIQKFCTHILVEIHALTPCVRWSQQPQNENQELQFLPFTHRVETCTSTGNASKNGLCRDPIQQEETPSARCANTFFQHIRRLLCLKWFNLSNVQFMHVISGEIIKSDIVLE